MPYIVVVMPQAMRQAVLIDAWWRANRPEAPLLFEVELQRITVGLEEHPNRGTAVGSRGHRRLVAPRTKLLIIYRIRPRARRVEVLEIRRP